MATGIMAKNAKRRYFRLLVLQNGLKINTPKMAPKMYSETIILSPLSGFLGWLRIRLGQGLDIKIESLR